MADVLQHYEALLADHYTWLFGGLHNNCRKNRRFFSSNNIKPGADGMAIDLGCGTGFQSIPLAQMGFNVTSIDLSPKLLAELAKEKERLPITIINDDLLHFDLHCPGNVELVICMGDTLTHLETKDKVSALFEKVNRHLKPSGQFVITYRDLSFELNELERFIPVNSDETKIWTCFLEYEDEKVKVHDLIHEKHDNTWVLKKSYYRKLRLPSDWVIRQLKTAHFQITHSDFAKGVSTIIANKTVDAREQTIPT